MRFLTIFNLTLVLLLAAVLMLISPKHLFALVNIPGLLVVVGGTLCALMLSKPQHKVLQLLRDLPAILKGEPAEYNGRAEFKQLLRCAHLYRSSQIRTLEKEIKLAKQLILIKGVQLVLDRCALNDIKQILSKERGRLLAPNQERAQMCRLMSSYAPAFGMLGTLLGMIHMLYGLGDVGLGQIGETMGFAMLTTLYGLVLANLICKPLAIKLERRTMEHAAHLNTLIEGLMMMHEKKHPMLVRDMLEAHGVPVDNTPKAAQQVRSKWAKLLPLAATHVD